MPSQTLFTGTAAPSMHIFLDRSSPAAEFLAGGCVISFSSRGSLASPRPTSVRVSPSQLDLTLSRPAKPLAASATQIGGGGADARETTTPGSCWCWNARDESLSRGGDTAGTFYRRGGSGAGEREGGRVTDDRSSWGQGRCACDPGAFRSGCRGPALSSDLDARAAGAGRCPRPRPRCRCPLHGRLPRDFPRDPGARRAAACEIPRPGRA
jgi:hypothetical protein